MIAGIKLILSIIAVIFLTQLTHNLNHRGDPPEETRSPASAASSPASGVPGSAVPATP